MIIDLVRHGRSTGNAKVEDPKVVGDHNLKLVDEGWAEALNRGDEIGAEALRKALIYCSPFRRTRETLRGIFTGAGISPEELAYPVYEDPRLREIDHGYGDVEEQERMRKIHGAFWYRYIEGGESPADGYDRMCTFLESLKRQVKRKKAKHVIIVSHGVTIRCFVMRYLHLSPEQFALMRNPKNCDRIRITLKKNLKDPQFVCGRWGVEGLRLRKPEEAW